MKELIELEFERLFKRLNSKIHYKLYWNELVELYSQKDRHYHDLQHITAGLEELKKLRSITMQDELVEFAWFYHDSIYSTGRIENDNIHLVKDNEEKSAELACKIARDIELDEKSIQHIKRLILLTKHDKEPDDFAGKIIIDIDLAIFGQRRELFDEYEQNIRKEYVWVPDEMYKAGRSQILQSFLKRNRIYYTNYMKNKYEEQARENLKWSLTRLKNGSG